MNLCDDHRDVGDECLACRIVGLEERLAHMQMARDNACALLEENQTRWRVQRQSVGRRISELVDLIQVLCQETPQSTRDWARGRVAEILDSAKGTEKPVAR
jgi:hypothetical protein